MGFNRKGTAGRASRTAAACSAPDYLIRAWRATGRGTLPILFLDGKGIGEDGDEIHGCHQGWQTAVIDRTYSGLPLAYCGEFLNGSIILVINICVDNKYCYG